jgi:hypothetical protein
LSIANFYVQKQSIANFGANPESENPKNWHKTPALQS